MNIVEFYQDHGISYQTEGHKHCRPGWVNIECPFCLGNPGFHLGYNISSNYFYCWRCGWHPTLESIAKILEISKIDAKKELRRYRGFTRREYDNKNKNLHRRKPFQLPAGNTIELSKNDRLIKRHKKYLIKRKFDPNELSRKWLLYGTGPIALLDDINYRFRILAPIYFDKRRVSFQARDITDKAKLKYMACPIIREEVHHKNILYGNWTRVKDTAIIVEGIFDVWRLGTNAYATFGIEYTTSQVKLIAKAWKRVIVLFDNDPQSKVQARKLVAELSMFGTEAWAETVSDDPASMNQDDANYMVKELVQ